MDEPDNQLQRDLQSCPRLELRFIMGGSLRSNLLRLWW